MMYFIQYVNNIELIMKLKLFALLAMSAMSQARPVTLSWDPVPVPGVKYNVYVKAVNPATPTVPAVWVLKSSSDTNTYTADFPDTVFQTAITAYVPVTGTGTELGIVESAKSAEINVPVTPPVPGGLKLRVTFRLEKSDDLGTWSELASIQIPTIGAASGFIRVAGE